MSNQDVPVVSEIDNHARRNTSAGTSLLSREDEMLHLVQSALASYAAADGLSAGASIAPATLLLDVCPNSVALLQVYTLLVDALGGIEFPTAALFDYPSVGELAEYLAELH